MSKKYTFEYVRKYFEERGCELLEIEYKNANTPMKYKCFCGNISKISFANFKRGQRCKKCWVKNHSGENNYQWVKDRKSFKEFNKLKKRCYRLLKYSLKKTYQQKTARTKEMLGYTFVQLKDHVFNHPNWEKVKNKKWHLDHIFPIQAFVDYGIKDLKLINALDNLQPLSKKENLLKHCKYDKNKFEKWLVNKGYDIIVEKCFIF